MLKPAVSSRRIRNPEYEKIARGRDSEFRDELCRPKVHVEFALQVIMNRVRKGMP